MRLLFLSPQMPWPPHSGGRLRVSHLLRAAASAHAVDLLTFADAPREDVPPEVRALCGVVDTVPAPPPRPLLRRAVATLAAPIPDLAQRLWSPAMRARLAARLASGRYDAVQACGFEVGRYLLDVRGPRAILDEFNVEYQLQASAAAADRGALRTAHGAAYSTLQAAKLRRFEAMLCRRADLVLAVSEEDAAALRALAPGARVDLVPNGVDTTALAYREPAPDPQPNLLFSGSMDYRPNADAALWFAREALPGLKAAVAGVRCYMVGRRPWPALVEAGKTERALVVTGAVPEMRPYWDLAAVYVLPMRMGGGVRFKALEALSLGIPLVSTGFGMQGLAAEHGVHYLRAESGPEFVAAVSRLLADAALRTRLARAGRALVEARHDWRHIGPRLLRAYETLT